MPRGIHSIPVRELNAVHAIPQERFAAPEPWVFVPDSLWLLAQVFGSVDLGCLAEDVGLNK
jgi:hypothetical protein